MKKLYTLIGIILSLTMVTIISGCGGSSSSSDATVASTPSTNVETGVLSLRITDAKPRLPKEAKNIYIRVTSIEVNYEGEWTDVNDFEFDNDEFEEYKFEPQSFDLLELRGGKSLHLGNFVLPAGSYKEIRFKLAAPVKEEDVKSNPDCNITFVDGTSVPLFVPSGGSSGYKGKGDFDITANAQIAITADFNVEKSIVVAGNSGKYLLKPVIRLVVTELSGTINGTVVDIIETFDKDNDDLTVYAYEHAADIDKVDEVSGNSDGILFPNAVTSADVNMTDGNFTLPFLEEGQYDLVTVKTETTDDGTKVSIVDEEDKDIDGKDIIVSKAQETFVDVNTSDYPTP